MWCADTKKSNESDIVREHVQHLLKLQSMKSFITTNPPKHAMQLKRKPKRLNFNSKITLTQQENKILLQKMYEIDSRPQVLNQIPKKTSKKSLNRHLRVQSLSKIVEENQTLLIRLQRTKSSYSKELWQKEHEFKSYLKIKLSQNSRRIPRVANLNSTGGFSIYNKSLSRTGTADCARSVINKNQTYG